MKKVLVVCGSPRSNGATSKLCDAFVKGAESAGHEVIKVMLGEVTVNGCRGCETCQRTGKCVQNDDMTDSIFQQLVECDVVVTATPVYCYMGTALLKAFIERTYPLSAYRTGRKETILLATAGAGGSVFNPLVEWYRANADYIGWRDRGSVLAGGCYGSVNRRFLDEAEKLGASI